MSIASNWPCYVFKDSHALFQQVLHIRTVVYLDEQKFSAEDEWDGIDDRCLHFLMIDPTAHNAPVGTLRYEPGSPHPFQRLAVLIPYRKLGVGSLLLKAFDEYVRRTVQGQFQVVAWAQVVALDFYRRNGFTVEGEEFIHDAQPHQQIRKVLEPSEKPVEGAPRLIIEITEQEAERALE